MIPIPGQNLPPRLKNKEEAIQDLWQFILERFKFILKDGRES